MYLEHFGLKESPFKITPATDFFFSGDNRGEILDALIYAIARSEGIIKITGEVGSGKTTLCRMLLERLPPDTEKIYLANPSLSRDELLHAIADGLGLGPSLEGQRVNVIMQTLQNQLEKKSAAGKRVVVLVDEAHAMPLDTLEELRLLYNLQRGDTKLLQIVLFGQPELNEKLDQPNMRQLKDRIVHHFHMMPLSKSVLISYLLFRMRAAGYRGPNIFSPAAVKLLNTASNGLLRRVNILTDKALLAAFIENTHNIEVRHVKAAIRDSEFFPRAGFIQTHKTLIASGIALCILLLAGTSTLLRRTNTDSTDPKNAVNAEIQQVPPSLAATTTTQKPRSHTRLPAAPVRAPAPAPAPAPAKPVATSRPAPAPSPTQTVVAQEKSNIRLPALLQQRLSATQALLAKHDTNSASIQLFYSEDAQTVRMERFLKNANELGKLSEIYILPARTKGRDSYRVMYGAYPNIESAQADIPQLPQRYQDVFAPKVILLNSAP